MFLKVDDRNRPHCGDGPFCRWSDGSALYAWHGTRLPRTVIEDRATLTAKDVFAESNAEVRRAMIEIMGYERFIETAAPKVLDASRFGRLLEARDIPVRFVEVENRTAELDGTFRRYLLPVPGEVATAEEAVGWTFNRSLKRFRELRETKGWMES